MKSILAAVETRPTPADLAWRVLTLVNLFRLLTPLLLAGLYFTIVPPPVGQARPALFLSVATGYFAYAVASIYSVKQRWPDVLVQSFVNVCVDVFAISTLTYASGGMSSGPARQRASRPPSALSERSLSARRWYRRVSRSSRHQRLPFVRDPSPVLRGRDSPVPASTDDDNASALPPSSRNAGNCISFAVPP